MEYYKYNHETIIFFRKEAMNSLLGIAKNYNETMQNLFNIKNANIVSNDALHIPLFRFENIWEHGFISPSKNFNKYPVAYDEYIESISSGFWKYYNLAIQANDKYVWIWLIFFGAYTQKDSSRFILNSISDLLLKEIINDIIKIIGRFPDLWIKKMFHNKIMNFLEIKNLNLKTNKINVNKKLSVNGKSTYAAFPFISKNISLNWINPIEEKKFKNYFLSYRIKKITRKKVFLILDIVYKILLNKWKNLYLIFGIKLNDLKELNHYFNKLAFLLIHINGWDGNRRNYWLWRMETIGQFSIYDLERICNDIRATKK